MRREARGRQLQAQAYDFRYHFTSYFSGPFM
jgi:hypothetical protein